MRRRGAAPGRRTREGTTDGTDNSAAAGGAPSRRDLLAAALMATGLAAAYATLAVEVALFILPRRLGPKTRKLFLGRAEAFPMDAVRPVRDLKGGEVLVKRGPAGFAAFSSVCPHLGCRVHWQADAKRFFCPCHRGVFDADGVAIAGPPADAGQRLAAVPLEVDEAAGVLYLQVEDPGRRRT